MILKNITPGFKDWNNIEVYGMSVKDGVVFMSTSDGIDIMNEDTDEYYMPLSPAETEFWKSIGAPLAYREGCDIPCWIMRREGAPVRELTAEEKLDVAEYVNGICPDGHPWLDAVRGL